MTGKLPAPCEHCNATGIFHGCECVECRGKGYRLMIDGHLAVVRPPVAAHGQHSTAPRRFRNAPARLRHEI